MQVAQEISVKLSDAEYQVVVGNGLLDNVAELIKTMVGDDVNSICIISNPTVFKLYGSKVSHRLESVGYRVSAYLMKDGEQYKSIESVVKALDQLAKSKLRRTDVIISIGGGVVGDLGGFAAAVFRRGVPFVQIPTTLLAAVDSSVGGKVAVNFGGVKNIMGAFSQPRLVFCDLAVL